MIMEMISILFGILILLVAEGGFGQGGVTSGGLLSVQYAVVCHHFGIYRAVASQRRCVAGVYTGFPTVEKKLFLPFE